MQLVRTKHDSNTGIHALSVAVKPKQHKELAEEMCAWLDENNGKFEGEHNTAIGVAHCQVTDSPEPIKLFVVQKDLVKPDVSDNARESLSNTYFEAQAIFNCEILETPKTVKRNIPSRKVSKPVKGQVEVEMVMEEKDIDNLIVVPEACMSFPHRKQRNKERYHTIKVRYQYLTRTLGIERTATFEGWVEGFKAHVIQHEVEHFEAKDMYHAKS